MQKIFLTIFIVLEVFIAFPQEKNTGNGSFKISNLKTSIWDKLKFHIGLSVTFDIEFPASLNPENDETFNITLIIKDSIGNTIFNNPSIYSVVYAKSENLEGSNFVNKGVDLFIPDYELNVTAGKHNLTASMYIRSGSKDYGEIYSGKIPVVYLNYYNYDDQEFKISGFNSENKNETELDGIFLRFNSEYKFMSQQIKDYEKNENSKFYYYYFTIYDENNKLVYSPTDEITEDESDEWIRATAKEPGKKDNFTSFIPFRRLNLSSGAHKLKIYLSVTSKNRDYLFKNIAKTELSVIQPNLYIASLNVSNLKVKYGIYDSPNVFGRIFSKKNKGYGYPDLIWKIKSGNEVFYYSDISKNSFNAYDGGKTFKLAENDPLDIFVEDHDQLINNDLISEFRIPNKKGELEINQIDYTNKDIEKMNFIFSKIKIPRVVCRNIQLTKSSRMNVSGFDFIIDFDSTSLSSKLDIELNPFSIAENDEINYLNYFRIIENEELKLPGQIILNQMSKKDRLSLFIPHYSLGQKSMLGFATETNGIKIDSYNNPEEINIAEINDIKFDINNIGERKISGINGVLVTFNYNIPALYLTDLGVSGIELSSELFSEDKKSSFDRYYESVHTEDQEYNTIRGFIPFYKLAGLDHELKCVAILSAAIKSNRRAIGKNEKTFTITIPPFSSVIYNTAFIKCKNIDEPKLFIRIKHHDEVINLSETVNVNKKIALTGDYSARFSAHPEDDIVVEIVGLTSYETETVLGSWIMPAKDFDSKTIKLPGNKVLKKIKLLREDFIK